MAEKETKMSEAKLQKAAQIEEIKEKIGKCGAFAVVDYKGISVADDTKLRSDFRKNDVEYRVLKNRLVLRALSELNIGGFEGHLEGPTAIAFAYGDPLAAAKVVSENAKTVKAIEIKCGLMDGAYIDAETVAKLAAIPSKEVLLAQLLGLLQSPLSGLARAVQQIAEKKQ